jgi:hypothetical protein
MNNVVRLNLQCDLSSEQRSWVPGIRSPQAMPEGNQDHGGVRFAEGQLLSDMEDIRDATDVEEKPPT